MQTMIMKTMILKFLAPVICFIIIVPKSSPNSDHDGCQPRFIDSLPIEHFKNLHEAKFRDIQFSDSKPAVDNVFSKVRDYFIKSTCGDMAVEPDAAIVNGTDAPDKAWPWQTLIHSEKSTCGGILISDRWVLSAAHCFPPEKTYYVEFGMRVMGAVHGESVFTRVADIIVIHENYTDEDYDYDIALVKLDSRVRFSERVRPACLPLHHVVFNSSSVCYISGFGKGAPELDRHITLQQLKVFVVPLKECMYIWRAGEIPFGKRFLCVDAPNMAGACLGDSGGPLSCKDGGKYYVAGVTNFVITSCMSDEVPDVYARVPEYLNWIFGVISKHGL